VGYDEQAALEKDDERGRDQDAFADQFVPAYPSDRGAAERAGDDNDFAEIAPPLLDEIDSLVLHILFSRMLI
jgi:hypothetical protein